MAVMTTPLTDTSPAGLLAAIEADIVATRLTNTDVPVEPRLDPDAAWGIAPDPGARRGVVVRTHFTDAGADRRIGEILDEMAARQSAAMWWVAPHHRPADLADRLLRHGFERVGETAAMALDLDALPGAGEVPAGLTIQPVGDLESARAFVTVIMTDRADGAPRLSDVATDLRTRHIHERMAQDPAPMRFVGWLEGEPVATSRLSIVGGVAGLYGVVTVPRARGRGFGRAMTLAALDAGRRLGMRIATLQATELGLPIYRRLGFEELFRYELLIRPVRR